MFQSALKIIKYHWLAFVLALVLAVIIILPNLLSINNAGWKNFNGIYPQFGNDDDHYLSMAKEVADGHYNLGNPYIKEYKDKPYLQQPLAEIIYSLESRILGLSLPVTFVANDFILPFIAVLLFYSLLWYLLRSRGWASAGTAIFFLLFINTFNRPTNPQISFIFLILGLQFLARIIAGQNRWREIIIYNVCLALCFGCLFYIYPFYWMTLVVFYGVASLFSLCLDRRLFYWIKNWLVFAIPAALLALPYFFNYWRVVHDPYFAETFPRFGFILTHWPASFVNVGLMALALPLAVWLAYNIRQQKYLAILVISLPLTGIILNWQNILTGKILQFSCHFYPIMVLFLVILMAWSAQCLKKQWQSKFSYWQVGLLVYLILMLFFLFVRQRTELINMWQNLVTPVDISAWQKLGPVADWLNNHTPADSTVYTIGIKQEWFLPIYTKNNNYFHSYAGFTLMSDGELEDRWVRNNYFNRQVDRQLVETNRDIWANKFIDSYQNRQVQLKIAGLLAGKSTDPGPVIPVSVVDDLLVKYQRVKQEDFVATLKKYQVDYILLDTGDSAYSDLADSLGKEKDLELLTKIGQFIIYKVK